MRCVRMSTGSSAHSPLTAISPQSTNPASAGLFYSNMSYGLSTGKFNQGASFNGTTSKIVITGWTTGNTFTISLWVYPIATSDGYAALIVNNTSNGGLYYMGAGSNPNKLNYYSGGDRFNTTALSLNTWTHVVISVSATTATWYLNGKQDGTVNVASFALTNIGMSQASENFKGYMDELILENRAWSASEVRKYYSQAKGRFVPQ